MDKLTLEGMVIEEGTFESLPAHKKSKINSGAASTFFLWSKEVVMQKPDAAHCLVTTPGFQFTDAR